MASETRPGVIVTQALTETTAVTASPTLVPLVMAPCFQIIKANNEDGTINDDAKHTANYTQSSMTITQAEFPDPRGNIDEINIYENEVEVHITEYTGLTKLERGSDGSTGSAFLQRLSQIYRPAIVFEGFTNGSISLSEGDTLVFAIDVVNTSSNKKDVAVIFSSSDTTAEKVAAAINAEYGSTVAFVNSDNNVVIFSPTFGPAGSVTIREGATALATLFGVGNYPQDNSATNITGDIRVEGSGLFAQDDEDSDLLSPYIAFSRGKALFSSTAYNATLTEKTSWPSWAGYNIGSGSTNTFSSTRASAVTFTGSGATIPLKAATTTTQGDILIADSRQVANGEVILVEESRFKIGTINTKSSTYSASTGNLITRIYDTVEFNILTSAVPFCPQLAFFEAKNLVYGQIENQTTASISGTADNVISAQKAIVSGALHSDLQNGATWQASGTYIVIQETIDNVQKEAVRVTFQGSSTASEIASAVTNNSSLSCTAAVVGENFVISSSKTGKGQSLKVLSTGTINAKLGFSDSAATSSTGRDPEAAGKAVFTTEFFDYSSADVQTARVNLTFADASDVEYTVDGTLSSSAPFASMAAVASAISDLFDGQSDNTIRYKGKPVATVEADGDTLVFSTIEGGSNCGVLVQSNEVALGIYDSSFKKSTLTFAANIGDLTGFDLADDDGAILSVSGLSSPAVSDIVTALNNDGTFSSNYIAVEESSTEITVLHVNSAKSGNLVVSNVTNNGNAVTVTASTVSHADVDESGTDLLIGTSLVIRLDDNPTKYVVSSFDYNSVNEAADKLNLEVGGDTDIATVNASGVLTLTSPTMGVVSKIEIVSSESTAHLSSILDFATLTASGSGRPNPNFYIDPVTKAAVIGPNILRHRSTGIPFSVSQSNSPLYIDYKGLRLDVTASASSPGLLSFGSITEIDASIGPMTTENPLGLAAYLCFLNSATSTISCLGVDETTLSAPTGTVDSYLRALELVESKEVYSIAPMTEDPYIQQLIATHVQALSQPSERGERIALLWKSTPERATDTSIENGAGAGTLTGEDDQLRTAVNLSSSVISAGITDDSSISVDDGLYVEITTVSGSTTAVYNYSISSVDGFHLNLRTSFSGSENSDGFYSDETFSGTATYSTLKYVLRIRGKKLLIKGTSLPDVAMVTQTAAEQASGFDHRRVFLLFGDSVDVSIDGTVTNIPGYYISAGLAGMIGSQQPQQPFTNLNMVGYSKVYGTDDTYSENQLDVIADGGRYVLKNLAGGIAARHQRSTSNSTIEARELSITKAIDYLAKGLREINRVFIGKFVITPGFLDQLTMANEGFLRRATQQGVVRSSSLKSLLQSETAPDTVLIEVEVQPAYPCNKIQITIVS